MMLPEPFLYPTSIHSPRHGPAGYQDCESFKDWLRDDFSFGCVYCLFRERWYPNGSMSFSIDHVIPRSTDPGGLSERDYGNLVYACNRCKAFRGVEPVLNPTQWPFGEHLEVLPDGVIRGRTDEGREMIRTLRLNHPTLCDHRRRVFVVSELKSQNPDDPTIHELFVRDFGYPNDLPDLRRLRPPLGNTKPGSEEDCYCALGERGELAEVY